MGLANRPRPTPIDPVLASVGSVGECVRIVVDAATWRRTLALALAVASRLMPQPGDDLTTRCLMMLMALSLGSCVGDLLDRKISKRGARPGGRST